MHAVWPEEGSVAVMHARDRVEVEGKTWALGVVGRSRREVDEGVCV